MYVYFYVFLFCLKLFYNTVVIIVEFQNDAYTFLSLYFKYEFTNYEWVKFKVTKTRATILRTNVKGIEVSFASSDS